MNTPAHAIINLLLFKRSVRESYPYVIIFGAVLPDVSMFVFYIWAKLKHLPEKEIWSEAYYLPNWQALFDSFHSFPLLLTAWCVAWRLNAKAWMVFFASMLLHSVFDFPVHHDDAHRHFYPLSEFRFSSPISYWDPEHYGLIVGGIEFLVMLIGGFWLFRVSLKRRLRMSVATVSGVYFMLWGAMMLLVWKLG